jgi:hypothetical protein
MTSSVLLRLCAAGLFFIAGTTAASAHHSFNMFDLGKSVTVTGTVKSYQWAMPHVWVHMIVVKPDGKTEEWGMECHAPNIIARRGWKSSSVKPGDKISVVMHPMKDGSPQGSLVSLTTAGGQTLTNWD